MKRIISVTFIFILLFSPFYCLYAQDKAVAVVNNEIITQKDLNDFYNFMRMQYSQELKGKALEEKISSMKQDLLNRLIEDRLILQKAKDEKIIIEPAMVKAKINEIKKRYNLESDFQADLARQGLVQADLENKIREQMLTYSIIEQKVRSKVIMRPDEVTTFYSQNKGQFLKPEERILTVLIFQDEGMAKNVSYQLRKGMKIEDLAAKYQFTMDIFSAAQGQELRSEIEETVFRLGIGEVSGPVKIDQQYYVFRLDNIIASQQMSLVQAQGKIQEVLFEKKIQKALVKWLDELKSQSYIKIHAN